MTEEDQDSEDDGNDEVPIIDAPEEEKEKPPEANLRPSTIDEFLARILSADFDVVMAALAELNGDAYTTCPICNGYGLSVYKFKHISSCHPDVLWDNHKKLMKTGGPPEDQHYPQYHGQPMHYGPMSPGPLQPTDCICTMINQTHMGAMCMNCGKKWNVSPQEEEE